MIFEIIPALIALIGVCVAVYTDLRWRIIPDKINYSLIVFGILYYLFLGLYRWDLIFALYGGLGALLSFIIGYALWLTGGWAGGDVKLFTALGALLYGYKMPGGNPIYPVPITILFNSVIAILPVLLVYVVVRRVQGHSALYESVKITQLKEGMIPAETIYEKDGKIGRWASRFALKPKWDKSYTNPSRASGLTRYQVGVLRRLVRQRKIKNELKIKMGVPFAPALGVGVVIAVFFGDIYWRIILWLFGVYP